MIYVLTGFFAFFSSFFRVLARYDTRLVEFILLMLMILIATFRSVYVGADTLNYTNFFQYSPSILSFDRNYLNYLEPGFRAYLILVKTFTSDVQIFYFISSLLSILPVYFGLKKLNLKYSVIGLMFYLFIFYIPYPLNALRQAIAMSFFIYSLQYFVKKDLLMVSVLTIIASSFHMSGIFIFLSYIIYMFDYKKAVVISFLSLFLLFLAYYFNLGQFVVFGFGGVDSEVYSEKYSQSTSVLQYLYRIIFLCMIGFWVFRSDSLFIKKIFIIYFIGFIVFIVLSNNNMIATRFNMFFRGLEVALIPLILAEINRVNMRVTYFLFMAGLAFFVYYQTAFLPENIYEFK